jgi:hypothetical protein
MPWYTVRYREVADYSVDVEAASPEQAAESVRSDDFPQGVTVLESLDERVIYDVEPCDPVAG